MTTATIKKIRNIKPPFPFEAYSHVISQIPKEDGGGFLITFPRSSRLHIGWTDRSRGCCQWQGCIQSVGGCAQRCWQGNSRTVLSPGYRTGSIRQVRHAPAQIRSRQIDRTRQGRGGQLEHVGVGIGGGGAWAESSLRIFRTRPHYTPQPILPGRKHILILRPARPLTFFPASIRIKIWIG